MRLLLFLSVAFFVLTVAAQAQKVTTKKVSYKYLKLPSEPLNKDLKSFLVTVEQPKLERIKQDIQNTGFSQEGNAKSLKIFNTNTLTSSVQLYGFSRKPNPDIDIIITLKEYERTETASSEREAFEFKTMEDVIIREKTTYYFYYTECRLPVHMLIKLKDGTVIYDQIVEGTDVMIEKRSEEHDSEVKLDQHWKEEGMDDRFQDELVKAHMQQINEFINDKYGYTKTERKSFIRKIESKKHNYLELDRAAEAAAKGYKMVMYNSKGAEEKIGEAVEVWENTIKKFKPKDKKAKVNSKVAQTIYLNLAEAYTLLNRFEEAEGCFTKFESLKPSSELAEEAEDLKSFMEDQKQRVNTGETISESSGS